MSDRESTDLTDPLSSSATDLIADFHARHEAWRRQGQDLERLKSDARLAAGREAETILSNARADIHRIVVDARKALLVLTAQLQAIGAEPDARAGDDTEEQVPDSVLQARRDLQKLLADVRPDLDEVEAQVEHFTLSALEPPPVAPSLAPVEKIEIDHDAFLAALAPPVIDREALRSALAAPLPEPEPEHPLVEAALEPFVSPRIADYTPPESRRGKQGILTVIALLALSGIGGAAWWTYGGLAGEDLKPPMAFIPRASQTRASWLDEQVPTLTASLISLPSTSAAGQTTSGTSAAGVSAGDLSLDLEVRRPTWVESSIDSGAPTSRTFRTGETLRLHGARDISIMVRDAGAVVVSVNGGPRLPLGPDGQVVTRHFAAGEADAVPQ